GTGTRDGSHDPSSRRDGSPRAPRAGLRRAWTRGAPMPRGRRGRARDARAPYRGRAAGSGWIARNRPARWRGGSRRTARRAGGRGRGGVGWSRSRPAVRGGVTRGRDGWPEIAPPEGGEEGALLLGERAVEPEEASRVLDLGLRGGGIYEESGRVAGETNEEENDGDDTPDD